MKFRFGTGFQSEIEFLSVADNLFYHRTHLVDLNGIDDKIPVSYTHLDVYKRQM